ncbi:hypothetical protein ACHQM5_015775 [Ranunculus cassubicifolius]
MVDTLVPSWLKPLLTATYFGHCEAHGESAKCECNFFCLVCERIPICSYCLVDHKDHPIVQIRRSSYNDVVRLSEISQYIDATNIQTYRINNARIIFLNERPIIRPGKGGAFACDICKRNLIDPYKFCSLGCKFEAVKKAHPGVTFDGSGDESPKSDGPTRKSRKKLLTRWIASPVSSDDNKDSSDDNSNCDSPSPTRIPTHRRKGIPRRASFF